MASNLYAQVPELRDRLGSIEDTDRDYAFENCLAAASRWIDKQTGRRFYTATETRYYTPPYVGAAHVPIDDFVSITLVATDPDGDGVYETEWTANADYWLGPRNAVADGKPYRTINRNRIGGRHAFPFREGAIKVTGDAGYCTTTPDLIRELCLIVGEFLARPVMDLSVSGVQSYTIGTELTVAMKPDEMPSTVRQIIDLYTDRVLFA